MTSYGPFDSRDLTNEMAPPSAPEHHHPALAGRRLRHAHLIFLHHRARRHHRASRASIRGDVSRRSSSNPQQSRRVGDARHRHGVPRARGALGARVDYSIARDTTREREMTTRRTRERARVRARPRAALSVGGSRRARRRVPRRDGTAHPRVAARCGTVGVFFGHSVSTL